MTRPATESTRRRPARISRRPSWLWHYWLLQAEIAQAQLAVKKANLRAIRAKLDAGADARVVPIDRARLRAQLRQAMSGDADLRLTLAARGNDDHDIDDLIDDLAELDNETGDRPA